MKKVSITNFTVSVMLMFAVWSLLILNTPSLCLPSSLPLLFCVPGEELLHSPVQHSDHKDLWSEEREGRALKKEQVRCFSLSTSALLAQVYSHAHRCRIKCINQSVSVTYAKIRSESPNYWCINFSVSSRCGHCSILSFKILKNKGISVSG